MFATMTRVQSVAKVASRCRSVVKVATSDVPRKVRIHLLREPAWSKTFGNIMKRPLMSKAATTWKKNCPLIPVMPPGNRRVFLPCVSSEFPFAY